MASRCDCCVDRKVESLDHVFSGEVASQLWQKAAREVGISVLTPRTWWGCVSQWFALAKRNSQRVCSLAFCLVLLPGSYGIDNAVCSWRVVWWQLIVSGGL